MSSVELWLAISRAKLPWLLTQPLRVSAGQAALHRLRVMSRRVV